MATIIWRAGSAAPLTFQPVQPDGSLAPIAGLSMQLRVAAGAQCIPLDGRRTIAPTAEDSGFDVDLTQLPDLPPRVYIASEYYDDGAGWRHVEDHQLIVEGGC